MAEERKQQLSTEQAELEKLMDDVLDTVENMPGVRLIEYEAEGIYLTVHSPKGNGKPITVAEIVKEFAERQIPVGDEELINKIISECTGYPVKVADPQPHLIKNGEIKVSVASDKMFARLRVYPPQGGKPATMQDAMEALATARVTYGIDENAVRRALELCDVSEDVEVARGKKIIPGKDAEIDYKFSIKGIPLKPTELADGRVDFYNLGLVQNVTSGQVLATKKPATNGENGMTVTGDSLQAKAGKDKLIKAGKNTELIDSESTLIATSDGHVLYNSGKIGVFPVFEVNGDVDFTSGNIDFVGSVVVKGNVNEGFIVKAAGDVEVNGSVMGGSVICGGHLKVKNGINGYHQKGKVAVEGNIFVKFIENASITCGGDIFVGEAIMHSHVAAKGTIVVGGRKGVIVGGVVRAGQEINAKIVGSNFATPTELEAGINPELRAEYIRVSAELKDIETNLDKTQKALKILKHLEQTEGLNQDKKVMLVKLSRSQFQIMAGIQGVKDKLHELEMEMEDAENGRIIVSGMIHCGVRISIGKSIMQVYDEIQYACLTREAGEIQVAPYK